MVCLAIINAKPNAPKDEIALNITADFNHNMVVETDFILFKSFQQITAKKQDTKIDNVEKVIENKPYPSMGNVISIP